MRSFFSSSPPALVGHRWTGKGKQNWKTWPKKELFSSSLNLSRLCPKLFHSPVYLLMLNFSTFLLPLLSHSLPAALWLYEYLSLYFLLVSSPSAETSPPTTANSPCGAQSALSTNQFVARFRSAGAPAAPRVVVDEPAAVGSDAGESSAT